MKTVFSAMRPTGKLHLGHLLGALRNWVDLQDLPAGRQDKAQCIYSIADWHALMSEYEQSRHVRGHITDMVLDWLACGIDPDKSIVYLQSDVPEHLELQMVLACLTPLGWLERNPTYKEQLREIASRDLQTYAFLGYPVLQAADILLYKADAVPIGEDQVAHLELCREIGRRFNFVYQTELFPDCKAILTPVPRLLGTDNRKMSKSYNNAINLSDTPDTIRAKTVRMITDPKRIRMTDPGHPDECNVYSYYKVFAPDIEKDARHWCSGALKGCVDCKKIMGDRLVEHLGSIREKRVELGKDKDFAADVLREGAKKARVIAAKTMAQVKEAVFVRS